MIACVVVMGACSLLIGLLPIYASWGPWAAYALLGLRMLQGLSVGGEYTGSINLVFEISEPERRSWLHRGICSWRRGRSRGVRNAAPRGSDCLGMASALFRRCGSCPSGDLAPKGHLPVSAKDISTSLEHPVAFLEALWRYRITFLRVMAAVAFADMAFYMVLGFSGAIRNHQGTRAIWSFSVATAINESIGVGLVLLAGRLSDRHGALRWMRLSCVALGAVLIPSFLLMQKATLVGVWLGQLLALVPFMLICGSYPSLLPGQLPADLRCTGFSLAYSLVVAVLGGTAPLVSSWLLGEMPWSFGPAL